MRDFRICPICVGVVIAWVIGMIGLYANQPWADPLIIAILLGASIGALADKYGGKLGFIWKTLMVILGLPASYFIVQKKPFFGFVLLLALGVATVFFGRSRPPANFERKDLFKECC